MTPTRMIEFPAPRRRRRASEPRSAPPGARRRSAAPEARELKGWQERRFQYLVESQRWEDLRAEGFE
jgi:hypothetical protein